MATWAPHRCKAAFAIRAAAFGLIALLPPALSAQTPATPAGPSSPGGSAAPSIAPIPSTTPAPVAPAGPDLDTTIDYISQNSPAKLEASWVQTYDAAGDRDIIKNTTTYNYVRATRCSLTVTKNVTVDLLNTDTAIQTPQSQYYIWGLHIEDALTDYKLVRNPTVHNQINGAANTTASSSVSVVFNFDKMYVGDLKLYPAAPNNVPFKTPFAFSNSELATRVLRAVNHAAELCGSKVDPFAG